VGIFGYSNSPQREFNTRVNQSAYGYPFPVCLGTGQVEQSILWTDGFTSKAAPSKGGGKGGGKSGESLYSADVVVALCCGPISGVADVWSGQSWLGSPTAAEQYAISSASSYTYVPVNATNLYNDLGVAVENTYSGSYSDFGAPSDTSLSGTDLASMTLVPWYSSSTAYAAGTNVFNGTDVYTCILANTGESLSNATYWTNTGSGLTTGTYSIDPSNNGYTFSSADNGRTVQVSYSYLVRYINQQQSGIVPSGKTISVGDEGSGAYVYSDLGVTYYNTGVAFKKVTSSPSTGQYYTSGDNPMVYHFATGDINQEVVLTWQEYNPQVISPGQATSLNYTLNNGAQGQAPYSFLTSSYPDAAFGYTNIATLLYEPMDLGMSSEIQENRFEVITPDVYGGGIQDCNPVQCIGRVLTDTTWGLGVGPVPFPTASIDNSADGTWGGPASTPGQRSVAATAWNWFAAQSFFISPVIDGQDTAASTISKWLEAGMCAAFFSEGLLKLVPYGDTSAAANGVTWTAPSEYVVALDDTCFVAKEGEDPVKISRVSAHDAWNVVQIQWDNRLNQYAPEVTQESDQGLINRWGERREDVQDYDFIHTVAAATFAANMRIKHNSYIRNTYEFTLPFTYSYLEPMDIVTLTTSSLWAANLNNINLGIVDLPVRVTKIMDDPEKGLQVTCEDYPWGAHQPTLYNKQLGEAQPPANAFSDPGNTEVVMFEATNALTGYQGDQIWIGALGTSSNWGSCNIWVAQVPDLPLVSATTTPADSVNVSTGTATASWSAGNTISVPGIYSFTVEVNSSPTVVETVLWASNTSSKPNGYLFRFDSRSGYNAGQIWVLTAGVAGTEGTAETAANVSNLPAGTYTVDCSWSTGGVMNIYVNGVWQMTLTDTTYTPTGATYYGYNSAVGNPCPIGPSGGESGDDYVCVGTITAPARLGELDSTFASHADPDTTDSLVVDLAENCAAWEAGTKTDADYGNTMTFVDGEIISYSALTYTNQSQITCGTYIRRGQMGSAISSHSSGGLVLRLDSAIFKYTYPAIWRGQTLSFKFQSVNFAGYMAQDLSTLTPVSFTLPGENIGSIDAGSGLVVPDANSSQYIGVWSSTVAYVVGNQVTYTPAGAPLPNYYTCIVANTNEEPDTHTTYWQLAANNATPQSGVLNSLALTSPLTYASTSSSITWTVPAMLAYLANGTTQSIASSQEAVTGLNASTTYYFYPTYNVASNAVEWIGSSILTGTQELTGAEGAAASSSYISTSEYITRPATVSLEVWWQGTGSSKASLWEFDNAHTGTDADYCYGIILNEATAGEVSVALGIGTSNSIINSAATPLVNDGEWHQIVFTYDGANMCLYIDGTLNKTTAAATTPTSFSGYWRIGYAQNNFSGGYVIGTATMASAWNGTVLTASQVANHYSAMFAGDYTTVVLADSPTYFYYLNETSGTTATDHSGNSYNGTYQGTWTFNQSSYLFTPVGSPAVAWPSSYALAAQNQQMEGNIALASGSITAATVSSGSGGGTGGGSGGGKGGGCFSPNTLVVTQRGNVPFSDLREGLDYVLTANSTWRPIKRVFKRRYSGKMHDMGGGELVTPRHEFKTDGGWKAAGFVFSPWVEYDGHVWNLEIETPEDDDMLQPDTEHSFALANGWTVHNNIPVS